MSHCPTHFFSPFGMTNPVNIGIPAFPVSKQQITVSEIVGIFPINDAKSRKYSYLSHEKYQSYRVAKLRMFSWLNFEMFYVPLNSAYPSTFEVNLLWPVIRASHSLQAGSLPSGRTMPGRSTLTNVARIVKCFMRDTARRVWDTCITPVVQSCVFRR
jgi:hypothetical protein